MLSGVASVLALELQKRAARIIAGADWNVRSFYILSDLNWTRLADRRSKQMKTLMCKTVDDLLPEYIFDSRILIPSIDTIYRDSEINLFIPRPNSEALKKSSVTGVPLLGTVCLARQRKPLV